MERKRRTFHKCGCVDSLEFTDLRTMTWVGALAMRLSLLAAAVLLLCTGCQQGFHPHVGRSVAFEHWFPVAHTHAVTGKHSQPAPCPYFDPPPRNGAYGFCEDAACTTPSSESADRIPRFDRPAANYLGSQATAVLQRPRTTSFPVSRCMSDCCQESGHF